MSKKLSSIRLFVLILFFINSFSAIAQTKVPEGVWRGVFHLTNGTDVPFNFQVDGETAGARKIYLLNGGERFETSALTQRGDSLFVAFDQFDNELAFAIGDNKLTGTFRKKRPHREGYPCRCHIWSIFPF